MITALVFDLDDTLYREIDYVKSGFKAVHQWLVENYEINEFYIRAKILFESGETKNTFNKTLDQLNISYDKEMINKLVTIYREHDPDIKLLEDANWVLTNLNKNIKLGIISDGYVNTQKRKVNALRLTEKFESIVLTDTFGRQHWKPSPFPYERIKGKLMCSHDECVYVGDNITKDFVTAKRLGWKTVQIKRDDGLYSNAISEESFQAHYQIKDLRELRFIAEFKHAFK
ncbi:HAD family hydrolase [Pseudalkalibacillus caeni]|uniref:HAD family hydrolase n=1 Tax=Exobacillus caeni TaxID=2574798 RepID=A0A5R9EXG5_9BACL|nr:HAD family hydrolase [Pseudalkalibacillus caeni]TLS35777.1 HAD family hydrolase [Pseudalkalibacillus caeni]